MSFENFINGNVKSNSLFRIRRSYLNNFFPDITSVTFKPSLNRSQIAPYYLLSLLFFYGSSIYPAAH